LLVNVRINNGDGGLAPVKEFQQDVWGDGGAAAFGKDGDLPGHALPVGGMARLFYGSRCEKYDTKRKTKRTTTTTLSTAAKRKT